MRKLSENMTTVLSREDFINESDLKEKYNDIKPLEKYKDMVDPKLLNENERVKKFDEYTDNK